MNEKLIKIDQKCSRCKTITSIPYFLDDKITSQDSF